MERLVTQNVMHASLCHKTSVGNKWVGQMRGKVRGDSGTGEGDRGTGEGRKGDRGDG